MSINEVAQGMADHEWERNQQRKEAMASQDIKWVTAYEVTRHFGGPEEGGWWYNHFSPLQSIPVSVDDVGTAKALLQETYGDRAHGDIYSVRGGVQISIHVEDEPCEDATTERPRYE